MKKFLKNSCIYINFATMTASFGRQVNDAPIPANQSLESIGSNDGAGSTLAAS